MLRIRHCLDNGLTDGGKVVSLTHWPSSTPQGYFFLFLIFFSVSGLLRTEGLGKLKKLSDLLGSRTRDLPACYRLIQERKVYIDFVAKGRVKTLTIAATSLFKYVLGGY
jgi:hypothetical protein